MRGAMARRAKALKHKWNREYYECVKDLIEHPVVQEMKKYPHHCDTNCYQHCVNVSYYNYQLCRLFGLDARSAARAGMLHDLFLYNWREHAGKTGDYFHAMSHPKKSLNNAEKFFKLNQLEREIILKHMWPVTVIPPHNWESFIIGVVDKYCGICEIVDYYSEQCIPANSRFLPFSLKIR